jgi:hypothetical protein
MERRLSVKVRPILPFWFRQRQIQAEPVGENALRLQGPNLPPCEVRIELGENGNWRGLVVRLDGEPQVIASGTAVEPHPQSAWQLAFELYRKSVVN